MPTLSPAALVCARFGGSYRLAALLGMASSSTWRWTQTGRIPHKHVEPLLALARKHRVKLTRSEVLLGV